MPSLRRTVSSPAVRTSPYKPFLSNPTYPTSATRTQGPSPRRSSGSDVANRRVLADIEWWKVVDGQCHLDTNRSEDENHALERDELGQRLVEDALLNGAQLVNADIGTRTDPDAPPEPLAMDTTSAEASPLMTPVGASPQMSFRRHQTEPALVFATCSDEPTPEPSISLGDATFDIPDLEFDPEFILPKFSLPSAVEHSKDPFLFESAFDAPEFLSYDDDLNHLQDFAPSFVSYSTGFF
ncbi:hypothetical protein AX16_008883 [Volvariella volvacea WC 439]|nr:hypothetical protein AX16_008883 [Volvariella volvacea WC 439]